MHSWLSAVSDTSTFCYNSAARVNAKATPVMHLHMALRRDLHCEGVTCMVDDSQEDFAMVNAFAAGIHKEVQAAVVGAGQANYVQQPIAPCCGQEGKNADNWPKDKAPCPVATQA